MSLPTDSNEQTILKEENHKEVEIDDLSSSAENPAPGDSIEETIPDQSKEYSQYVNDPTDENSENNNQDTLTECQVDLKGLQIISDYPASSLLKRLSKGFRSAITKLLARD